MKNFFKVTAIVVFTALFMQSNAQISISAKAGLNFATMVTEDVDDLKMKTGLLIGGVVDYNFSDQLALETGLLFSSKGYKWEDDGDKLITSINYIDVPILAKARYDLGSFKIYGLAGPYLSLGLNGKFKWEDEDGTEEEDIEFGEDLNRSDFGLMLGGGVEINAIQIGLCYSLGLADIDDFDTYNRVFSIQVGYRLFGE